ncbi:MAG: hypothetical protein U0935_20435 [Pirellulales bacterium]
MIEDIGLHGPDDGDVIDDPRQVQQAFGYFRDTLAVRAKRRLRAEQFGVAADEGEPLVGHVRLGNDLAVQFLAAAVYGIEERSSGWLGPRHEKSPAFFAPGNQNGVGGPPVGWLERSGARQRVNGRRWRRRHQRLRSEERAEGHGPPHRCGNRAGSAGGSGQGDRSDGREHGFSCGDSFPA